MSLLRNLLLSRRFHSLLNPKNPHTLGLHPTTPPHSPKFEVPHRPIASLPQISPKPQKQHNKKPLSALFIGATGPSERTAISSKEGVEGEAELKKKPRHLTEQVRSFKEKTERRSLYAVFSNQPAAGVTVSTQRQKEEEKLREPLVVKELSPDVVMFAQFLYQKGYFKDANFVKSNERFDLAWFQSYFARGYIKFAAKKFAMDHQDIAKSLSESVVKKVAVFGCPSANSKSAFCAKRLRKFFDIPEDTICSKCMLQQSCKFVNRSVNCDDTSDLDFVIVMKVITSYALELVHPQLVVSDEVNKSVSHLLKEVVKLSQKPPEIASG